MSAPTTSTFGELVAGRELLFNLTMRELRGKYKRSTLGWAWSLLNPLSTMAIFSVVFGVLLKVLPPEGNPSGLKNFTFYLTCALLPWNFTAIGIMGTLPQLVANSNLIKKVYFPRVYVVAASVFAFAVAFLLELTVLCVAFVFVGQIVLPWIPIVLLLVLLQTMLVLGYSLALSALNVYFRDVQHFAGIAMQVWFYLTPIVYPIEARDGDGKLVREYIPTTAHWLGKEVPLRAIYKLNPMVHFVEAYRVCLYDNRIPGWQSLTYCAVSAFSVLAIGFMIFRRLESRFPEEL